MALIDLKSNLAQRIGEVNTDDGTFKVKQGDNTERTSQLTELPRPEIEGNKNPIAPLPEDLAEGIIRGGIGGQLESLGQVGEATSDFLTSPKGALFVAKQFVLQKQNASPHTRDYKPSSLIETQFRKVPRHTSIGIQGQNPFKTDAPRYSEAEGRIQVQQTLFSNPNKRVPTGRATGTSRITISQDPPSYNMKGKLTDELGKLPKDFIKFYIKDVIGNTIIQFPAYLNDITDNSSAEYNPTRYIGRADQVYVYSGYTRNISFGFRVEALKQGDVPIMWRKIDKLKALTLPLYSNEVLRNDNDLRPIAPFVELTIGDLYVNQPGFFSSVNITVPQSSTWEIDGLELSHLCDVSVDFTFIGNKLPSLGTRQFERGPLPKPKRPDIPKPSRPTSQVRSEEPDEFVDDFEIEEIPLPNVNPEIQQARNDAIRNVGSFNTADAVSTGTNSNNSAGLYNSELGIIRGAGFDTWINVEQKDK